MDLQALAQLNGFDLSGGDPGAMSSRAIDSDGDGRPDLYLVDLDSDGTVDGVVRSLDMDGDGLNDTFVEFNEDGSVQSIGRVEPSTGEFDVVYEEPDALDEILESLGLIDLESPEEALFTSFEDPYIVETYGSFGDEVPDFYSVPDMVDDFTLTDVSEEDAAAIETSTLGEEPAEVWNEDSGVAPPEVKPTIVEIEGRSGGDASSLWAKVDDDADGLADYETQLGMTSTGTYYGDIDQDCYSEDVATDIDMDGRIDTVDTTGEGSSTDTVGAEQIIDPASDYLVDRGEGEDDFLEEGLADAGIDSGLDYDTGTSDMADMGDASVDTGYDGGSSADTGIDDTV